MAEGRVWNRQEVVAYTQSIKAKLILDKVNNLYIIPRSDQKNQQCMSELGLKHNDVADIILAIDKQHYVKTVPDMDIPGEWLWIFHYYYDEHQLYIKIKLRERVICVSFHELEYDI